MQRFLVYYARVFWSAIVGSYGVTDFITGLAGAVVPPLLTLVPQWRPIMDKLWLWMPLGFFAAIGAVRLIYAPFAMHKQAEDALATTKDQLSRAFYDPAAVLRHLRKDLREACVIGRGRNWGVKGAGLWAGTCAQWLSHSLGVHFCQKFDAIDNTPTSDAKEYIEVHCVYLEELAQSLTEADIPPDTIPSVAALLESKARSLSLPPSQA